MNQYQQHLIKIGKQYFQEIAKPKFDGFQRDLSNNVAAFFSGSVAYGFCDKLSDIEMEYYISKKLNKKEREELEKIFSGEHEYKEIRISDGITEWKIEMILNNKLDEFWKAFNPYQLYEMTHVVTIHDPNKIMQKVAKKVSFYPQEILMKVIRGLWITANDSGIYNADYAIKRGKIAEAHIFLYRGLEALLRLIYILNKEYYPHSKWLTTEFKALKNDFNADQYIEKIFSGSIKNRHKSLWKFTENVGNYLESKKILKKEECNENPWANLDKPFYTYNTF